LLGFYTIQIVSKQLYRDNKEIIQLTVKPVKISPDTVTGITALNLDMHSNDSFLLRF